jgi:hypothetical protein
MHQPHSSSRPREGILAVSGDPGRFQPVIETVAQAGEYWRCFDSCPEAGAALARKAPRLLVVDFRMLGRGQLPLLAIARREGVEILAVGPEPMGVEKKYLADIPRLDMDGLIERIREVLDLAPEAPQGQEVAAPADQEERDREEDESGADATEQVPQAEDLPDNASLSDADLPDALCDELQRWDTSESPRSFLTAEELAALLEKRND